MSVSLSEVLAGAEAQAVPLSAECAGYLVLAAADQAALSPRRVQAGEVCLLDDGAVRLLGGAPSDDVTAESDLRELLGGLLSSASSTTAGLMRARRRASGAGVSALLRELERALIPVNRSAARRALARLARETVRAKDEGRLAVAPAAPDVVARPVPAPVAVPAPAPVAAPVPEPSVSAAPPLVNEDSCLAPSVAPPVVTADDGLTVVLPRVEVTERLVLPVAAAVMAPAASSPEESETRPEPVVVRASQRPPAPAEPLSVVIPPRRDLASSGNTPVLGTVVAPALIAEPPRLSVAELAEALATPEAPEADELDLDVEVTFSEDESTIVPEDVELILLAEDGHELERTEPCPSPLTESVLPPEVAARPVLPPVDAELPDDVLASAPAASVEAPEQPAPSETPEAPEVPETGTVLPPWVMSRPAEEELSPLPHVAVPRPRESNVEDLLEQMASEAVGVDELRSGLKSLAGLEPTPPPPGSLLGD